MKKVIIIILCMLVVFYIGKDIMAKNFILSWVRSTTGINLNIQSMRVGIFRTLVDIKGLTLYNPRGFPDRLMADMPEIYVDYDLGDIVKRRVHLEEVRLNLKELLVIRNENNKVNLDSLKIVQAIKEKGKSTKGREISGFQIDLLKLKIEKVIYKDYSKGIEPLVIVYDVDIDEEFKDIRNPYEFVSLLVVQSLAKTRIADLSDFDIGPFRIQISEVLKDTKKAVQKVIDEATEETTKKAIDALKKIVPIND